MALNYKLTVRNINKNKELIYNDTVVLSYEINYPHFESENFKKSIAKINKFYEQKAKKYQDYCESKLYKTAVLQYDNGRTHGFPHLKYDSNLTYTITYNQNCALSLYFDQYEFAGGAHGITLRFSNTWCLFHGNQIKLHNLFPNKFYDNYILENLKTQIGQQLKKDSGLYFPEYKKLVTENFSGDNFFLDSNGVIIYFQLYEIAPYVAGFPQFLLYYKQSGPREPRCIQNLL